MTTRRRRPAPQKKAWSGRFTEKPDPRAEAYTSSLEVDGRLLPYDVVASLAHAEMLKQVKVLTPAECKQLQSGLRRVLAEWERDRLAVQPADEDVHMLVERRLFELVGPVAGKLHTARSRNDQVLTDLKLYLRDETEGLITGLRSVQRELVRLAQKHFGWIMPGYTHLQVAQPVLVSHWLLAHAEALRRDELRFTHLRQGSLESLPLGAAALAGTSHPIDRQRTAQYLGFDRPTEHSMDTVGDRDFGVEFLAAAALCGVHASRLAEELVLFASAEFRFLTVSQGFSTGSSIMPQKRNPDVAELVRGRSGRLVGNLVTLLTVLKGLPLTYNRDLQEDKEPIFDSADHLGATLQVLAPLLAGLTFHRARMEQAAQQGYPTATEAADHLARQGVPFREAHAAVGRAVTAAAGTGRSLASFSLDEWRKFHRVFSAGVVREVTLASSVASKRSWGGTAPQRVQASLQRWQQRFGRKRAK